jgi:LmbE family N-acetylglucosaminyl deacetylase
MRPPGRFGKASGPTAPEMLSLELPKPGAGCRILCLGAHCDDIEIGCGGTLLRLLQESADVAVDWVVFSGSRKRAREARNSADSFLKKSKRKTIVLREFPDGFFPYHGGRIKRYFETLKAVSPDLIFTHYRNDLHQDHRLLCELTWNTFRDHLILEYEIPKYDGDLGSPNCFVELDERTCRQKIRLIMESFKSQGEKHWFSQQTFLSMLTLRGMESRSTTRYAEAFYGRKLVLGAAVERG